MVYIVDAGTIKVVTLGYVFRILMFHTSFNIFGELIDIENNIYVMQIQW